MDAIQRLREAGELLGECARQLQRTGGQLNRDLAYDASKLASLIQAEFSEPIPEPEPQER